jgi:outer membrane protein assembly factor BamB
VANGVVFVAERDRGVAAYPAGTGAELWRYPSIADGTDPIVANGGLYVGLRPAGSSGPANLSMFEL